jgi:hypothetical protein
MSEQGAIVTTSRTAEFVRRLTAPEPAVLAQLQRPDEITSRILDATLEQAELVGMRRITMEDVARSSECGASRWKTSLVAAGSGGRPCTVASPPKPPSSMPSS